MLERWQSERRTHERPSHAPRTHLGLLLGLLPVGLARAYAGVGVPDGALGWHWIASLVFVVTLLALVVRVVRASRASRAPRAGRSS